MSIPYDVKEPRVLGGKHSISQPPVLPKTNRLNIANLERIEPKKVSLTRIKPFKRWESVGRLLMEERGFCPKKHTGEQQLALKAIC